VTPRPAQRPRPAVAAAAALLLVPPLAARAASAPPPPGERVGGRPAAAAVEETDRLTFEPGTVDVPRGGVVEWTDAGVTAHNVTFDRYPALTSGTMQHGDRYEIRFSTPGTYPYRCTFHPGMDGTVHVSG
jgi:plastocyanin